MSSSVEDLCSCSDLMVPSHNKTGTTSDRALISIALQHLHQLSLDTLQKQSERYLAFSTGSTFPHEKNIHLCNKNFYLQIYFLITFSFLFVNVEWVTAIFL